MNVKQLKTALVRFDDSKCHFISKCGNWSVARGGYDLFCEVYYYGNWIASITYNGSTYDIDVVNTPEKAQVYSIIRNWLG